MSIDLIFSSSSPFVLMLSRFFFIFFFLLCEKKKGWEELRENSDVMNCVSCTITKVVRETKLLKLEGGRGR